MTYITHYCEWATGKGSTCANALTEKAYNYSMAHYRKPLCYGHQLRTNTLNDDLNDWENTTDTEDKGVPSLSETITA